MLHEIAALTAQTIERVEVLDLERSVALTLQLGLLALDMRSTQAIVRARYQAADAAMEIGGDWYDAVELDDGRLAIAVGDVVGRGLPAATTMGQLRAALGITALQAADPSDAVGILDRYASHVPGAVCATVAFAMLDPAAETHVVHHRGAPTATPGHARRRRPTTSPEACHGRSASSRAAPRVCGDRGTPAGLPPPPLHRRARRAAR